MNKSATSTSHRGIVWVVQLPSPSSSEDSSKTFRVQRHQAIIKPRLASSPDAHGKLEPEQSNRTLLSGGPCTNAAENKKQTRL